MITQEELHELLEYNPETGLLRWRKRGSNRKIGWFPGTFQRGRFTIMLNRKNYYVHDLAWLYVYGELVTGLDHINRNSSDNRISNLRVANASENQINSKLRDDNTSGYPGVVFATNYNRRSKPWIARIKYKEISKQAYFKTREEAVNWRRKMELELYKEFVPLRETPDQREKREYLEYRAERYEIEDYKAQRERPIIFPWKK